MKKGLHLGALGRNQLDELTFRQVKGWGYDGVELILAPEGALSLETSDVEVLRILQRIRSSGLSVVGVTNAYLWHFPLTSDFSEKRSLGKYSLLRQAELCAMMDTDAALVVPGYVRTNFISPAEVIPYNIALERAFEGISVTVSYAETLNVRLLLENVWNHFLTTPQEMRDFIDRFSSSTVGQYLDIGNVMINSNPNEWISVLGKRIGRVHIKDYRRAIGTMDGFCDLLTGDIDYSSVMHNLNLIGYDGFLTAELHHETGEAVCRRTSEALSIILALSFS